jgi:hypothetical protein
VVADCNDCNEALNQARDVAVMARRLVLVARNALVSGDVHRALAVLRQLGDGLGEPAAAVPGQRSDQME